MKRFFWFLVALLAGLMLSGCGAGAQTKEGVSVVCTIFPPYDFARQVSEGAEARVSMLIKPGVDSHTFDPAPADITAIQEADLFVYVGGENDWWVDQILESLDHAPRTLRLIDHVQTLEEEVVEGMRHGDEEEHAPDEHIWTSPDNAAQLAGAIAQALEEIDPSNQALYRRNYAAYAEALKALDQAFQEAVEGGVRKELVFADRFPFRYLTERYGLRYYAAFPGCSAETEPSAATLAFLIKKVREEGIPVVFHIEQGNERVSQVIAEEAGAKVGLLNSCHNITKADFDAGRTYLEIMWENVRALREGLA